jgi:hypothetical protein
MKTSTNIFDALKTKPKRKTKEENSEKDDAPNAEKQAALEAAIFQTAPVATLGTWADEDEDLPVVGFSPPTGDGWNMAKKNYSNSRGQRYLSSPQQEEPQPDAASESDNESVHLDIEAELGIEVARSDDDEDDDDSEDDQNPSDDDNESQDGENSKEISSDSIDQQKQAVDTQAAKAVLQLSKKEKKKKELEDLDAVLAELGLDAPPASTNGDAEGGADSSKAAKRRQKKKQHEASVASVSAPETTLANGKLKSPSPASSDDSNTENQDATQGLSAEAIKARKAALAKRMASSKTKSASASAAAAAAAAAAKAKKAAGKDKSRYNEMPTR